MPGPSATLFFLILFSAAFAASGLWYTRRARDAQRHTLEDHMVARNSQGALATLLTLLASSLGAWILFSPAEAATWGGLGAVLGYALGSMAPRIAMMPLGARMRALVPTGHSLTEFVLARYGRGMYALALSIMLFYMFISLVAEITAMSAMVQLLAPVPRWLSASIVMGFTLAYAAWGGLQASIFTDKVQVLLILPLLLVLVALGWQATGGAAGVVPALRQQAPQLLDLADPDGLKAGATFFVAILVTGMFHQGNWQRIYAARDTRAMRRGFLLGGILVVPCIFVLGLFGLAFVALSPGGDASVALFAIVLGQGAPPWLAVLLIMLGLALVMSSADTTINAFACIVAVDVGRLMPDMRAARLMCLARGLSVLLAVPVVWLAAQGYSVLYLFLLADLLCAAAAFAVFCGLYSARHNGRDAVLGTLCGLGAGLALFPAPGEAATHLLESFLLAALVPVLVIFALRLLLPASARFDWARLAGGVRQWK